MFRVLLNLLTSASVAFLLAVLILWSLVLMGSHYTFGRSGAAWGARAEKIGFLVYWDESSSPAGPMMFNQAENATVLNVPGRLVERRTLSATPPLVPTATVIRSNLSFQIQYWLMVVVFGLLPLGRLMLLRLRSRRWPTPPASAAKSPK